MEDVVKREKNLHVKEVEGGFLLCLLFLFLFVTEISSAKF